MSAVLYDGENVLADFSLGTPKDTIEHLMIMIKALIEPLQEKADELKVKISGLGLGVPSVMNKERRKIINAPNLQIIEGLNLVDELQKMVEVPVVMDNDVNCFLLGEMKKGVGQKYDNVYALTIGTGIGGAWWYQGQIYRGANGGGGEPSKLLVDYNDGIFLEEAYQRLTQNNPAILAEEAYRGDILAEKSFDELGKILGMSIASIVNLFDPEIVIVGGGVVDSSDLFLSKTKKAMREYICLPEAKKIKIVKSKSGQLRGSIGAACMANDTACE